MTTANSIYSFSDFTPSGSYLLKSYHPFSRSTTSKNYSTYGLNFTIEPIAKLPVPEKSMILGQFVDGTTRPQLRYQGYNRGSRHWQRSGKMAKKSDFAGLGSFAIGSMSIPGHTAMKATEIFNQGACTERRDVAEQSLLSPLVLSGTGVIGDCSQYVREMFSSYHKVYESENPAALTALGVTTGFNFVSGGLNVQSATEEIDVAGKISDTVGKKLGNLKLVRGVAQAAGGAIFIPVRALSISALMTSSKIAAIAGILGSIGSACFNVVSIVTAMGIGIRLHEQYQFRNELDRILKDPNLTEVRFVKALEYLKQMASVSPQEKEEIRQEIIAQQELGSLTPEQLSDKVEEKINLLLLKKEAYLKRLTDENCLTQIREKGPAKASRVIEAVQKKSKEKIILSSISMSLLVIGIMITAAAFIFTGPIGIIISAAFSLATSLGWLLIDGYGLIKEFTSTNPGRFDKLWMFISSLLAVISVSLVFFLSGGCAPIIAAVIAGTIWLAINFACYYRLYKLENEPFPMKNFPSGKFSSGK
jgi:hypothetical protein